MRGGIGACVAALAAAGAAWAVEPAEMLRDRALESRAQAISKTLRCVTCQNETIDDSEAPLAHDMRVLVRERLMAGDSDEQVRAYIVARYGNYVLLKPPLQANTWILWFTPFLLLALGAALFVRRAKHAAASAPAPLTDEERRALDDLTRTPNAKS